MKKISFVALFLGLILFLIFENYIAIRHNIFERFVQKTKLEIENEIESKKSSTLALAITMSRCERLRAFLEEGDILPGCLKELPKLYNRYTQYKNIKIEILDNQKKVLFRSWIDLKGEQERIEIQNPYQSDLLYNHLGFFIYSLASVRKQEKNLGYLIVLGHFNSIRKNLEKLGINMMVVVKDYNKRYKILDTKEHLPSGLIRTIISTETYTIAGDKIFAHYVLKDNLQRELGYIIFFAPKSAVLDRFFSKGIFYRIVLLFMLIVTAIVTLFYLYKREHALMLQKQARFFHNIFDTLQELVVVTDGEKLLYANKKFFEYFDDFDSLDDFFSKHSCICDFFVEEEGFLSSYIDGTRWTEFLIANEGKNYRVKIRYKDRTYIFNVKAQKLSDDEYSVIFVDVTQEYLNTKKLEKMATRDPLTGVYNRYMFEKMAEEKIKEAKLFDEDFLFVMIDLDHFKQINDTYGHEKGDLVLQEVSRLILRHFRTSDPVIRIGGEEFLVIVQTKNIERIIEILEDLKYDVEHHKFDGIERSITISIGVARFHEGDSIKDLYKRADQALYESKAAGRNRITYKG